MDLSAKPHQHGTAQDTVRAVIHVCETCRSGSEPADGPRDGAVLAERVGALAEAGDGFVEVRTVACLANCKRALSAGIRSVDGWSYVFGDLTSESAEDLMEGARLLGDAADGLMPWKGRPDALKRGMIARIPPLDPIQKSNSKDLNR